MSRFISVLVFVLLIGCANGRANIDPSISDDLINISKALSEGKSVLEALGEVKPWRKDDLYGSIRIYKSKKRKKIKIYEKDFLYNNFIISNFMYYRFLAK